MLNMVKSIISSSNRPVKPFLPYIQVPINIQFHQRSSRLSLFLFLLDILGIPPSVFILRFVESWNEPIETHVRHVDRAVTSEQHQIVQEPSECAAEERCDHWDLACLLEYNPFDDIYHAYPEVIVSGCPHLVTVS